MSLEISEQLEYSTWELPREGAQNRKSMLPICFPKRARGKWEAPNWEHGE
jgi:hypothetical protein